MLVGRAGLSPTMVGRSAALTRLTGLLTSAGAGGDVEAGRPAVALVSGEAGIGKTRLLRELSDAVPDGTVVLAGQAEPGSLGRPYELVASLLGGPPPSGDDSLRASVDAIASRLGSGPALVVFDDLHWADGESVAVFERLASLGRPGLLVVGTYRPEELTRMLPAAEMLVRLERRQQLETLRLQRLTRHEVAGFLAAVYHRQLPSSVVDTLFNRTGGNPFFLEELLIAGGDADPEQLCAQPLPWSLDEVVQRQLDGLSPEERRVVEAAAVLGRRASFDVLASMTGTSEDELIARLRGLIDRGLLLEEDDDEFSFRHALVRDAVERQLLGRERRRLHATALEAGKQLGSTDLAQLARHAAGAGQYDEMVELAREGVTHYLGRGSSHQAMVLALEALPEAPDDPVLLEGVARAAWLTGQASEALPYAERWESLARLDGLAAQSAASRLVVRLLYELGRTDALWPKVAEIEALAEGLPPGEDRARNLACIAQMHMLNDHPEEAVLWAERAVEVADEADAKPVRAQALVERASALGDVPGRTAEGEQALREAIAEAEAVGDWVLVARGLNNMVKYVPAGAPSTLELLDRLRYASDRAGFDVLNAYVPLRSARYAIAIGDQAAARRSLDEALERAAHLEQKGSWCNHLEAFLLAEQGRYEAAAAALQRAGSSREIELDAWRAGLELAVLGLIGRRDGDIDGLIGRLGKCMFEVDMLGSLLDDIESVARLGRSTDEIRARLVAPWAARGDRPASHHAVIDAVLAFADDGYEEAIEGLRIGVDSAELFLPAYRRSALASMLARSLASLGRRAEAEQAARTAVDGLDRWPGWRRDAAIVLLGRLQGPAASADDGSGLSPREREVAALLAEGLSNSQLAQRLYISPKTASVHVSNILAKLGMSSRTEVAAWAVRTGVASASTPA
jgi:DNA-binding NarL/FixJ family response regulator